MNSPPPASSDEERYLDSPPPVSRDEEKYLNGPLPPSSDEDSPPPANLKGYEGSDEDS